MSKDRGAMKILNRSLFIFICFSPALLAAKNIPGGWVDTRESWYCTTNSINIYESLNNCILSQINFLERLIKKKLYPSNPYSNYDINWWEKEKSKIKEKCIKEAIKTAKEDNDSIDDSRYDIRDVYYCQSDAYSNLNRSLIDYGLPVKP